MMNAGPRILYCHCAYAEIVPKAIKEEVLLRLCDAGVTFDAVADLCEMTARQDPLIKSLAESGAIKIAACYPRAVQWLFTAAQTPLPAASTEVLNMRTLSAEQVAQALLNPALTPNLPSGRATPSDAPALTNAGNKG